MILSARNLFVPHKAVAAYILKRLASSLHTLHSPAICSHAQDSSGNGFTGTLYSDDGSFSTWSGVKVFDAYSDDGDTGIRLPNSFVTAFLRATNYTIMLHYSGEASDA